MNNEIGISPRQIAKAIDDLLDNRNDLQQRINKAIEYIENNGHGYDITGDGYYSLDEDEQKELLEILKGKEMIKNENIIL